MIDDSPGDVSEAARRSSRVTSCQLARALLTDIFGKSRSRSPHAADRQWAVCVLRTSHHLDGFLSPSLQHLLRAICLDIVACLPLGAMQVALVSSHASVPVLLQHPKMNKICCQTRPLKWSLRLSEKRCLQRFLPSLSCDTTVQYTMTLAEQSWLQHFDKNRSIFARTKRKPASLRVHVFGRQRTVYLRSEGNLITSENVCENIRNGKSLFNHDPTDTATKSRPQIRTLKQV